MCHESTFHGLYNQPKSLTLTFLTSTAGFCFQVCMDACDFALALYYQHQQKILGKCVDFLEQPVDFGCTLTLYQLYRTAAVQTPFPFVYYV